MRLLIPCLVLALGITTASTASAWSLSGRVTCEGNGDAIAGASIHVISVDDLEAFEGSATTGSDGTYTLVLPDSARCYEADFVVAEGDSVVSPPDNVFAFCTNPDASDVTADWVIFREECVENGGGEEVCGCWLTGGGTIGEGQGQPDHSYGGNVNPGCNALKGHWNHVAHALGLHFQAHGIEVVRCGNVDGIPEGSTSPVTPFNFIEFRGEGTVKGVGPDHQGTTDVSFFARCEDRGEPGSRGEPNEDGRDRYFLHVFSDAGDPEGSTVLLVDQDGDPATVDPIVVGTGNLQMHACQRNCDGSCGEEDCDGEDCDHECDDLRAGKTHAWLGVAKPNPTRLQPIAVRFGLVAPGDAVLTIQDVAGRRVRETSLRGLAAGEHPFDWDLRDSAGRRVPPGVYFLRLTVGREVVSRTVVLTN